MDDLIFTGDICVDEFKKSIKTKFEMIDLGMMKYFLDIEVAQSEDGIFINQSKYANDVLKRFRMMNCKLVITPIATGTKLIRMMMGQKLMQCCIREW